MRSDASALTFLNLVTALQQKLWVDEAQAISRPLTWPWVQFVIYLTSLATPRIANWKICFWMPARDESTLSNYSTCVTSIRSLMPVSLMCSYMQSLKGQFAQSDECSIKACVAFLQELSLPARTYFSEVVTRLGGPAHFSHAGHKCCQWTLVLYHEAHQELPEVHHASRPPQSSDDFAHLSR